MQRLPLRICLAGWLLFFSCTTDEGVLDFADPTFGALDIATSLDSARVFLDHRDTGRKSPVLLADIPSGRHIVHVLLPGYRSAADSFEVIVAAETVNRLAIDLTPLTAAGNLQINSTPPGALVMLNRISVGRTPLLLEGLPAGPQELLLSLGGYRTLRETIQVAAGTNPPVQRNMTLFKQVLLEHLSNTNCIPCPQADEIIRQVLEEVGVDSLASITYHPNYPGENDPFFVAAPDDILNRIEYYSVPPIPYLVVDGVIPSTLFNMEANLRNGLALRSAMQPPATLDIMGFNESFAEAAGLKGSIVVTALQDIPAGVFLRIAIIEKERRYPDNDPPGTNGETEFEDILRDFFPGPQGTPVSLNAGGSITVPFDFTAGAGWGEDLHIVAFLQKDSNREVLQSVWSVFY